MASTNTIALYLDSGTELIGKPPEWGKQQVEDYEQNRYHQPSDEFDPKWTYEGMIEDAQLGFYAGLSIAETPQLPAWNPGDEFGGGGSSANGKHSSACLMNSTARPLHGS